MGEIPMLCIFFLSYIIPPISSLPPVRKPTSYSTITLDLPYNNTWQPAHEPITCIKKPKMLPIDQLVCKPILDRLTAGPGAEEYQDYYDSSTQISNLPCCIELKRSYGATSFTISNSEIEKAASAVMVQCEKFQGAGWLQFIPDMPWYLLVYGGTRYIKTSSTS